MLRIVGLVIVAMLPILGDVTLAQWILSFVLVVLPVDMLSFTTPRFRREPHGVDPPHFGEPARLEYWAAYLADPRKG